MMAGFPLSVSVSIVLPSFRVIENGGMLLPICKIELSSPLPKTGKKVANRQGSKMRIRFLKKCILF